LTSIDSQQPVLQIEGGEVRSINSQFASGGPAVHVARGGRFEARGTSITGQPALYAQQSNSILQESLIEGGLSVIDGTLHATDTELRGIAPVNFERVVWLVWRDVHVPEATIRLQDCIAPVLTGVVVDRDRWHWLGDRDPNWEWHLADHTDAFAPAGVAAPTGD
jgi:hypothetical protein